MKKTEIVKIVQIVPIVLLLMFVSCEFQLPEAGSIEDATPPDANFSYEANEGNYKDIRFTNLSISATDYSWDFGDGNTSTLTNPSNTYATDGEYIVSLTVSDKLNVSDTYAETIIIKEPVDDFVPVILNPSFDEEGADAYRDNWRNEDLGGVIQITSDPVHTAPKAAKLPSAGDRIGYQLITVQKNKDYKLSFYYTMKESGEGSVNVSILAGHVTDPANIENATIASVVLNDQTSATTYVLAELLFNSGDNTEVAIFFTNVGVESRVDTFTIEQL